MRHLHRAVLLGLWLIAARVGAQHYDIRMFGVEDGLPGSTVTAVTQDSAGFLWVDTDGGLCRFDGRRFQTWTREFEPGSFHGSVREEGSISADERTRLSLTTGNGRSWRISKQGLKVFPDPISSEELLTIDRTTGLSSNVVNCIFEDASGVIWIGTDQGGLCRYMGEAITLYGLDGSPYGRPRLIARTKEGKTLMVCGEDGIAFDGRETGRSGSMTGIQANTGILLNDNRAILGSDSGLFSIAFGESGNWAIKVLGASLKGTMVNAALRTGVGSDWLAGSTGVLASTDPNGWVRVGRDTLLATVLATKGDSMLIGTRHGLFSAPLDNSAANWTPIIRAGEEDITCLAVDRANNIWIGTEHSGLVQYNNGLTQRRTTREGLASDRIRQLLLDAYQNLWVGTDRGFNLLELDELQEEVIDITYYGVEDGFPGIEAMPNACMLDTDSSLWFGTTRGTIHFDPRKILQDPIAPRTRITDLSLFFEHPDWKPWSDSLNEEGLPVGLHLPHTQNHLTFTFSGLSIAYPEKVRFQYKLEGRDADWSPITKEDHVTLSGLEPGEYTFLVKARNGSGVWNDEPARFSFLLTPPFWATTPFRLAGGAALLLGFFGFQRVRDRQSRRARERLERIVESRTRELTNEKHRSDTLLLNILPETTAAELKEFGTAQARSYAACTVLFSDFQGFTVLSEQAEATGIVTELDRFFRAFDRITDKFGTEKIKTIGDAYMCASGVPEPSPTHALDAVLMALEMLTVVDDINALREKDGHPAWPIRIGLNSGPLIAGVVGEKKFAYDVWGDTVNLASRMESSGAPGRVNVTSMVLAHVERYVSYEARGKVMIKGKGEVESWFIDRLRPEYGTDEKGRTPNDRLMDIRNALRTA